MINLTSSLILGFLSIGILTSQAQKKSHFHLVQNGETLEAIASAHDTTETAIRTLNPHAGADPPLLKALTVRIQQNKERHYWLIRRGDTLSQIARALGTTVPRIQELNEKTEEKIVARRLLLIPAPAERFDGAKRGPIDTAMALKLQIFLDRQGFGPGAIDGTVGPITVRAVKCYLRAHPSVSDLDSVLHRCEAEVVTPVVSYQIREHDQGFVGELAPTRAEQANQTLLPYRSLAELVAERFHTTHKKLQKLNSQTDLEDLHPGTVVMVPNVNPFRIDDLDLSTRPAADGQIRLVIDTAARTLEVHDDRNQSLLAAFPVTLGIDAANHLNTPWMVSNRIPRPNYTLDPQLLGSGSAESRRYVLPSGPNSPVGIVWMGISPLGAPVRSHLGIHGTDDPNTIARATSAGCVRLSNWDVSRLALWVVPQRTPVEWR